MKKFFRSSEVSSSGRTVSGYAIVFDSLSQDLGGFREIIRKGAVTPELLQKSDIFANWEHNNSYVLGRTRNGKGNIQLNIDDHGLFFEFELPETVKGDEVLSYITRGELDECSFCFGLDLNDPTCERWTTNPDGSQFREILKIAGLYDISLCFNGAYPATECSARDLEHAQKQMRINKMYKFYNELLDELTK